MNGEDLQFLAERASRLEDRTSVRLEELHARVAAARRRRAVSALAGATCLVVALVVGIQVVTGTTDDSSPDPAPTPLPERSATQPESGTCWNVPPESVVDQDYWFDDSAQVPCSEPHTTETAQVLQLTEPTIAEAKENGTALCWEYVRIYLGIDPQSWVPWGYAMFLPSEQQVADGASWLRCDVAFPETWGFSVARTVSMAAEGLADNPPPDFWACLDQPPTGGDQPFVSCGGPHIYEQTGVLAFFRNLQEYPSATERESAVQEECRPSVPEGHPDIAVTAHWDHPSGFEPGGQVAGSCFMSKTDGSPLPPRQP